MTATVEPFRSTHRPTRVCYMIDRWGTGGTETHLDLLIRNLDRDLVQPSICFLDGKDPLSEAVHPADVPVIRLGVKSLRSFRVVPAAKKFIQFLRANRTDIVELYFPDTTYFGAPLARWAGVRHVIRTRRNAGYWVTGPHRFMGRIAGRFVTANLANSDASKASLVRDDGVRPESVTVIHNGIDLSRFADVRPLRSRIPDGPLRKLGIVSNLRPVKNLGLAIRAIRILADQFPDITLHIAGEGPARRELETLIAELSLPQHVTLVGSVTDIAEFLGGIDIAIQCSSSEGLSNTMLEYMAAGRPIVASAIHGNRLLVKDEQNGLLFPPNDARALAGCIRRLFLDGHLALRLATNAKLLAESRYSHDVMIQHFCRFYHSFVACDSPHAEPM